MPRMNTRIRLFVAVSMLFVIGMTNVSPANAGFLDLFRDSARSEDGSFHQLYTSVFATPQKASREPTLSANALVAATTTATSTKRVTRKVYTVQVSGYNSEVAQTDDSPFITAKGTYVRDGIVATNMLPFGTFIKIPSIYGDKIFVVEDRMNSRYQKHVDIWFASKTDALALGRRTLQIEVLQ